MSWYAFRVEPQKEFAAQEIVNRHGFRAVVPHEWRFIRGANAKRRSKTKIYPYVIGYVFVEIEHPPNWYLMFSMHCLKSVVGSGGQPTPIPRQAIDGLLRLTGQSIPHVLSRNTRRASFVPGDNVRIAEGPFTGFEGRVETVHGAKARMVFEMLGAMRDVDVPLDTLEAA